LSPGDTTAIIAARRRRDELITAARKVRENAYAPFSKFHVGAALRARSRKIYRGCNVENATYGLTVCAERVAVWKAISEGERDFDVIAIVADTEKLTPPCGACRQILWEFCGDIEVILANLRGKVETYRLAELFPKPFEKKFL
jgi:cytidine deaminase